MGSALFAVVWANSLWGPVYHELLQTQISLGFGEASISKDLHHWINDGLMGVFFFLIGLEIKRELLTGELCDIPNITQPRGTARRTNCSATLWIAIVKRP